MEYEANGIIKISGCAGVGLKKNYLVLFPAGSKAYIKRKARFGKMEFIVIKKIYRQTPHNINSGIQVEIFYVDTFNRVWAEDELLSKENALDLANLYWQNFYQEGRELLENGGCLPIPPEGCD